MKRENENRKVSSKRQIVISALVGAFVGAILGIMAYNNGWLG